MWTTYSNTFFRRKNKLIKEIYNLNTKITFFECEIETLSPVDKVKSSFFGDNV